jgi:SAM-dependent methyltransferase
VTSREEAINYVHTLIARCIEESGAANVLDIGCGVGGSMIALSALCSARYTGITVSPFQYEEGMQLLQKSGYSGKCAIRLGDFTDPSAIEGSYDCACAVESFLHMPNADLFFHRAADLVVPGGVLIICDDFISPDHVSREDDLLLLRFREGWQVGTLIDCESVRQTAFRYGFSLSEEKDLSPFLELRRPRDRLIHLLLPLLRPLFGKTPFVQNMDGGDALQELLLKGVLTHRFFRFRRTQPSENREETVQERGVPSVSGV